MGRASLSGLSRVDNCLSGIDVYSGLGSCSLEEDWTRIRLAILKKVKTNFNKHKKGIGQLV